VRARAHGAVETDLHALAGAIVGSLVVLAVAWLFRGQTFDHWIEGGRLDRHLGTTYEFALGLLLLPYPIGVICGAIVGKLTQELGMLREDRGQPGTKIGWCFGILDLCGFLGAPTVWDGIWGQFWSRRIYVRVRTKTGQEIVGAFESGSWVGLSPEPPQLFLSTVYREEPPGSHNWQPVPRTKGVFIDGTEIESIEFAG
jgi:hypothetical protein